MMDGGKNIVDQNIQVDISVDDTNICDASKKKTFKSNVWKEFTKVFRDGKLQNAHCKHCKLCMDAKTSGGTNHLWRHLKYSCPARPGTSIRPARPGTSIRQKKCSSSQLVSSAVNLEGFNRAMTSNLCPSSIMNSASYFQLLTGIDPTSNMVLQATTEEQILSIFQKEKLNLKKKLKVTPGGIFLSVAYWKLGTISFLCLVVHYIDEEWKKNRRIITCRYAEVLDDDDDDDDNDNDEEHYLIMFPDWKTCSSTRKTSFYSGASAMVKEAVQDWGLEQKLLGTILALSVGNAVPLQKYIPPKFKLLTVPCMVDALHDLFDSPLKKFVLDASNAWFRYMTRSRESTQKYQQVLSQLHLERPSFGSKRWYLTYCLLQAALMFDKQFPDPQQIDSLTFPTKSYREVEATENFCKIVGPIYHAIKVVSSSQYATNSYFHALWSLRTALQESSSIPGMDRVVDVEYMQSKFHMLWDKWYLWLSIAVVLDPRYKIRFIELRFKKEFGHDARIFISEVYGKIYELFIRYSFHGDSLNNWFETYNNQPRYEELKQLHDYLGGELCPEDDGFDILKWWKDNASTYPTLARMARDVLAIPASTVSSESAFDECDAQASLFSRKLSPDTVEAIICAQSWTNFSEASDAGGAHDNVPMEFSLQDLHGHMGHKDAI